MISVRRIRIGEGELFKQMRLTSLREAPYAFSSTYESALRRSPESWREQADSTAQGADRSTFIAFSDNSQIGIAALYRNPEETDVGEVLQVWVAPEYRSRGVAFDLLDAVFQWAGENGFRIITATITKGNTRALKFYRKYGFDLVDGASLDGPDDLVLMKEVKVEQSYAPDALPRAGDA
jgi:ribosomal protein S18 acetylase RimI-like enzyme